jgi:hypothetical protein
MAGAQEALNQPLEGVKIYLEEKHYIIYGCFEKENLEKKYK